VLRDLFDDENSGWLSDTALVDKLAAEKLDKAAEAVRGAGNGVRRETGKELMMQVHHDGGVAIHIRPESCAAAVGPFVKR